MGDNYCLHNAREVKDQPKCHEAYIRFTSEDYKNGFRVDANALKFDNREKKLIRITNTYTFGNVKITAVWNNLIRMDQRTTVENIMRMFPRLSEIWLTVDGKQINGSLPGDLITKLVTELNKVIGHNHVVIKDINIDQFEMLRKHNVYNNPDLIFEKLLIYVDTNGIASSGQIKYRREIPDDIEMIISTYDSKNQSNVQFGQDGGSCTSTITITSKTKREVPMRKYFEF